jgi:hypothetical protein
MLHSFWLVHLFTDRIEYGIWPLRHAPMSHLSFTPLLCRVARKHKLSTSLPVNLRVITLRSHVTLSISPFSQDDIEY